ncbi:MAG: alanine--tRNA ligase-related protein [Deltaproteobacteria bacterium]|nr:alanine--tRNA ligase-related protein [Deltaproteobacteria bacterium]
MQGVTNNFHTDLFAPMIAAIESTVGRPYAEVAPDGGRLLGAHSASFRVLADHARAVAFLLADGVFPSNDGRGYVLRRILRRAVRHAYLLGRREPTLVHVVQAVLDSMGDVFPKLGQHAAHILETTRAEEERFLDTIEGGLSRFDSLAPAMGSTQGSTHLRGTISGDDAFRLYDTFGFPIDLTELMARERAIRRGHRRLRGRAAGAAGAVAGGTKVEEARRRGRRAGRRCQDGSAKARRPWRR